MASVLFLMRYPLERDDNLKIKFDGQMAAVRALGHEAACIGWDRRGLWLCREDGRTLLRSSRLTGLPGYDKTLVYVELMAALKRAAALVRFDAVYMRFMPVFDNAPGALAAVKAQGARLVVEHPTYPFENGKRTSLVRMPVFAWNARVFRRLEPMIDLYALIGEPCGGTLNGRPAMNILNGVDVRRLPLHQPRVGAQDVGMLALASMSVWQGYDRLIEALARYGGGERVTLHMVGGEGDGSLAAWKRLAQERGVADRVVFHGELHGAALDEVAAACDIGVGGLGLHRKGQYRSMTLKLREYMARGLPFVYAVEDPSLPEEPNFCLKIANDESAIDLSALVAFARRAQADAATPARMRAYAESRMSWEGVISQVLERVGIQCRER